MVLAQNRYEDQWSGTEDPEVNPHSYSYFLFDKAAPNHVVQKIASLISGAGKTGYM
jgi:hypothetical protein